jgi:hypothetical protein
VKSQPNSLETIKTLLTANPKAKPTDIYKSLITLQPNIEAISVEDRDRLKRQIYNYKSRVNSMDEENNVIDVDLLRSFINENGFNKENEFFILESKLGNGSNDDPFYIIFSSKKCLQHLVQQSQNMNGITMFGIDGTYKLNFLNYPLLIVATQDLLHTVFPVAFAISSSETQEAYATFLRAINTYLSINFSFNLRPRYVMSDKAIAIFNAVDEVYGGNLTHISCYFHMKQNLKKNYSKYEVAKEDRGAISEKIDFMRCCIDKQFFIGYLAAFKSEYKHYSKFISYFEELFLDHPYDIWQYFNIRPNIFTTNNILESLNNYIKEHLTERKRHTVLDLLNRFKEYCILLKNENLSLTTNLMRKKAIIKKAMLLAEKKLFVKRDNRYYVDRKGETNEIDEFITLYRDHKKFKSTSKFEDVYNKFYIQTINGDEIWCNCYQGFIYGYCIHEQALTILVKKESNLLLLMPRAKRGRKKKVTNALQKDESTEEASLPRKNNKKKKAINKK